MFDFIAKQTMVPTRNILSKPFKTVFNRDAVCHHVCPQFWSISVSFHITLNNNDINSLLLFSAHMTVQHEYSPSDQFRRSLMNQSLLFYLHLQIVMCT